LSEQLEYIVLMDFPAFARHLTIADSINSTV